MTGMTLDQMQLSPVARQGAVSLLAQCHSVCFTSGRRTLWQQAHAMAVNTALKRTWIGSTYAHAAELQTWVDHHPDYLSVDQLTVGLYACLMQMEPDAQRMISRHLTGDAFDVMPVIDKNGLPTESGKQILTVIPQLDGLEKFLQNEGGLIRWHVQFVPSADV